MAQNFPDNPNIGDQVTAPNGAVYEWDGNKWVAVGLATVIGTITGVAAGTGLAGGGTEGHVLLSLMVPVIPANGGTGLTAYSQGDLLYAVADNVLATLAKDPTPGLVLTNTGTNGAPRWDYPNLDAVNGTLLPGHGGTGITGYAQGDLIFATGPNTLGKLNKVAETPRYLSNLGGNGNPQWDPLDIGNAAVGTLAVGNGGTGINSYAEGDILYATSSTTLTKLNKPVGGTYVLANTGANFNPQWAQASIIASGGSSAVNISDTPPANPAIGTLWLDSTTAQLYVWYPDPNSAQWVPVVNTGGGGGGTTGAYLPLTGGMLTGQLTVQANTPSAWIVSRNSTIPAPVLTDVVARFIAADGAVSRVVIDAFGAGTSNLSFRRSGGTAAAPTAVQNTESLGTLAAWGYGTTGYSSGSRAAIQFYAAENWTDSAQGTRLELWTTLVGQTNNAARLTIDGGGNVTVAGQFVANGTGGSILAVVASGQDALYRAQVTGARQWSWGSMGSTDVGSFWIYDNTAGAIRFKIDTAGAVSMPGAVDSGLRFTVGGRNITPGQIGFYSLATGANNPAHTGAGMMGLNYRYTPASSTRVLIVITGSVTFDSPAVTGTASLRYGTGTSPANGAGSTGTTVSLVQCTAASGYQTPTTLIGIASGLTIGTAYWFDIYLTAASGTGSFIGTNWAVLEV